MRITGKEKRIFAVISCKLSQKKCLGCSQIQVKISADLRKSSAKISGKISQQVKTILTRDSHL